MKIEITVEELKELWKKTPVAGTTDVSDTELNAINQLLRIAGKKQLS